MTVRLIMKLSFDASEHCPFTIPFLGCCARAQFVL